MKNKLPRKLKKRVKFLYKKRYCLKCWLKCEDMFTWYNFLIKNKMNYV